MVNMSSRTLWFVVLLSFLFSSPVRQLHVLFFFWAGIVLVGPECASLSANVSLCLSPATANQKLTQLGKYVITMNPRNDYFGEIMTSDLDLGPSELCYYFGQIRHPVCEKYQLAAQHLTFSVTKIQRIGQAVWIVRSRTRRSTPSPLNIAELCSQRSACYTVITGNL